MGYAAMLNHAVAANAVNNLRCLEHDLVCCHYHIGLDREVRSAYFFFKQGTAQSFRPSRTVDSHPALSSHRSMWVAVVLVVRRARFPGQRLPRRVLCGDRGDCNRHGRGGTTVRRLRL